jgi:hypothetical protein
MTHQKYNDEILLQAFIACTYDNGFELTLQHFSDTFSAGTGVEDAFDKLTNDPFASYRTVQNNKKRKVEKLSKHYDDRLKLFRCGICFHGLNRIRDYSNRDSMRKHLQRDHAQVCSDNDYFSKNTINLI